MWTYLLYALEPDWLFRWRVRRNLYRAWRPQLEARVDEIIADYEAKLKVIREGRKS